MFRCAACKWFNGLTMTIGQWFDKLTMTRATPHLLPHNNVSFGDLVMPALSVLVP
jgi:hypothetical protein